MSKFWTAFDKMFENMGEMFEHLDDVLETETENIKITRKITKTVGAKDGEVHIHANGSAEGINKITDKIIEIIDQYNEEVNQ